MTSAVVPALPEHAAAIVRNVRPADLAELAALRTTPAECMRYGLRFGAMTGLIDGVPVCMFGVTPHSLLLGQGVPWMVCTADMDALTASKALLRHSRATFADLRRNYTLLFNVVDDRNTAAQRWLAWLGFTLRAPQPYGPDGARFRLFLWEA